MWKLHIYNKKCVYSYTSFIVVWLEGDSDEMSGDTELEKVADIQFYLVHENEFAAPKHQALVWN